MTVKLFIASTLDGYIATENEDLQWLFDVDGEGDNGYSDFYRTIDSVIMGKRTYDWISREQGERDQWPYANKTCYVLTHQSTENNTEKIKFIDVAALRKLTSGFTNPAEVFWVVGGGELIKLFLENHWVDELRITIAPVILGKGIPLFPIGDYTESLRLLSTKTYGQFVELHYLVNK